jgi:hypothetical protein
MRKGIEIDQEMPAYIIALNRKVCVVVSSNANGMKDMQTTNSAAVTIKYGIVLLFIRNFLFR